MSKKEKFALYLPPELRKEIDTVYAVDHCSSRTEFIEKAVRHYLGCLHTKQAGAVLPQVVSSVIEGRLGVFQDRVTSLMFKQAVELDMVLSLLAESLEADEESLRRLRGRSIANVKTTNGRLSLEQHARRGSEV